MNFRERPLQLKTVKSPFPDGLIFASGNRGKFSEVAALFSPLGIDIIFGPERASLEIEEDGSSYPANALLKARAWALETGLPALADDSGVEIRALGWKPGIHSARMGKTDEERVKWLLEALEGKKDRQARYVASFALYFPCTQICFITEGECPGIISLTPLGTEGFGYDPVFIPEGFNETFGQIPGEIKRKISHRTIAGLRMLNILSAGFVIE
jgi:XTP/dITP diphosphohydrolase